MGEKTPRSPSSCSGLKADRRGIFHLFDTFNSIDPSGRVRFPFKDHRKGLALNIAIWLARRAQLSPDVPALFDGLSCVADYAQFDKTARGLAAWLVADGVLPGDRVALFMDNAPDYLCIQYAAWYAGAAVVPINAKLHGKEAAWIIENAQATRVFANAGKADALAFAGISEGIVNVDDPAFQTLKASTGSVACLHREPDDLAWLFYTSGTTGQPKGVMITHRMLMTVSLNYIADVDAVAQHNSALYAAPLSHGAGLYNMMHVLKGARHVFPPSDGFDPKEVFELAEHFGNVHMFAAPTMVKRLTQHAKLCGKVGEGLRTIVYAGGPMYQADIIEAVDYFGDIFVQIYGQGECPMGITALSRCDVSERAHPKWRARLGSVGRAQSSVEVRVGSAGETVAQGAVGEIMVRGDTIMPGYWRNEAATSDTIVDGWLRTGDMGSLDEDGYLTLVDRSKDVIISGGSNIYPREVEEVLLLHDSVAEVSVVGAAHPEWGEEVVAFVVPAPDRTIDPTELDAQCLDHIARFKRPKRYEVLHELPKNNYGKVLKTDLRKRLS